MEKTEENIDNEIFGIIGALPEEIELLSENTINKKEHTLNTFFKFTEGTLNNRKIVYSSSNIGN
jgi:nucleoside phosphorylase